MVANPYQPPQVPKTDLVLPVTFSTSLVESKFKWEAFSHIVSSDRYLALYLKEAPGNYMAVASPWFTDERDWQSVVKFASLKLAS